MSTTIPQNVQDFIRKYARAAMDVSKTTGMHPAFTLASAGMESGWGKSAPDNNFHGIKAGASWKGAKHLSRTWEATKSGKLHLQPGAYEVRRYAPGEAGNPFPSPYYGHRIYDYFRSYATPKDSFLDHAKLLQTKRYERAWAVRSNPDKMAEEIMKAGYGTDPTYVPKLKKAIAWVNETMALGAAKDSSGGSSWIWWIVGASVLTGGVALAATQLRKPKRLRVEIPDIAANAA